MILQLVTSDSTHESSPAVAKQAQSFSPLSLAVHSEWLAHVDHLQPESQVFFPPQAQSFVSPGLQAPAVEHKLAHVPPDCKQAPPEHPHLQIVTDNTWSTG